MGFLAVEFNDYQYFRRNFGYSKTYQKKKWLVIINQRTVTPVYFFVCNENKKKKLKIKVETCRLRKDYFYIVIGY